ncbi:MAG: hypothetical protein WCL11_28975 [Verrucomicrobiota bacterium]
MEPPNIHDATVTSLLTAIEDEQIPVESPEQFEELIEHIKQKFIALHPESIEPQEVVDAILDHMEQHVFPRLNQEIRDVFSELYTSAVARELIDVSVQKVAAELRAELETPIRKDVWRTRDEVRARLEREMIETLKCELKQELEPSVRRELRAEILSKLRLNDDD